MKAIAPMRTQFEPGAPVDAGAIPLCVPHLAGQEWAYIKECLDTNFVSSVGPFVDRFEQQFAARVGRRFAVATVNGTSALHISLLVAGVQPDDEVVVSTLTFIAPANAVRYAGAWPVFVDAEPQYWQIDASKLADFLQRGCDWRDGALVNRVTRRRVRAIVPVHILGHPVDMDPIIEMAKSYNLAVIEDATESLGAKYRGKNVGQLGNAACFSFNGNKIITTGGGGMFVTDDESWARRAKYLTTQAKDDAREFIHGEVGYNYRLTNIQAAMGCAQLEALDKYISVKRNIAAAYSHGLAGLVDLQQMREAPWAFSSCWLYTALVGSQSGASSRHLIRELDVAGIQARPLWQPIHLSPAHQDAFATDCSVAERLHRATVSLPSSIGLAETQQQRVCDAIIEILQRQAPQS